MAGNKLSPRQKMINMMYLVLTALLALNINAEVLQGFESLRLSLETSKIGLSAQNQEVADMIRTELNKETNTHLAYLKPAVDEIQATTAEALKYLEGLTAELEKIGVRAEKSREIVNKDEVDGNYRFWLGTDDMALGGRGNGEASKLHHRLDDYVAWANAFIAKYDSLHKLKPFTGMVIEPKDDPNISDPESKSKVWEYHSFHNKPVVADLAFVEKFKLDVKEKEARLLNMIKEYALGEVYEIDQLKAMDAPSARVVVAGMPFETKLMVGMYSNAVKPEFMGSGITVDAGGSTATMKLTADGRVIPEGKNEGIQRYRAIIKVPRANGGYDELPVEGEFLVRRPEIVVEGKQINNMYRDCANQIHVDVPALGEYYDPDFSHSTGGSAQKGANRKDVLVTSSGNEFTLVVHSKSNGQDIKVGSVKYRVVNPPKPRMVVEVKSTNKELDGIAPVGKKESVKVRLHADPEFKAMYGKDARYKGTVKMMVQESPFAPPSVVATKSGDLLEGITFDVNTGSIKNASPGTRVYWEIESAKRVNFQNRELEIPGLARTDLLRSAPIR